MTDNKTHSIKVNPDNACFVCGRDNPIGLHAEFIVDQEQNKASTTLTISSNFQGWQGLVHGGIIATLLDETAIYACRPLALEAVTAGMTLKFKHPVKTDSPLTVKAEVVAVKRRIAKVSSCLMVDSVIMAEAEIKVMLLGK